MAKQTTGGAQSASAKSNTPATINPNGPTPGERFTNMVIHEFSGHAGTTELTPYQKRLIQNYFISIDLALKLAEEKRMKKPEKYRDQLEILWNNINMQGLAVNVVAYSRIGFDPALPNHINMMPFKNNTTNKYDIVFIEGYRGKELKAMKYGFQVPDDVIVEVVYENDTFKPIKKDKDNEVESYIFTVSENPFDRGAIIGGFYYHLFTENPARNKLMFYNLHEIEKRKPKYASAEFWGGEKDKWENGKKVGKEEVEGWYHEMVWKTIYRAAYNAITIDGAKIDDALMQLLEQEKLSGAEQEFKDLSISADKHREIEVKGNKKNLDIDEAEVVEEQPKEDPPAGNPETPTPEPEPEAVEASDQGDGTGDQKKLGPNF